MQCKCNQVWVTNFSSCTLIFLKLISVIEVTILKKLTDSQMEKISEAAAVAAENYIFSKISKKEVLDLELRVEFQQDDGLDVDVEVELFLDQLSKAEETLADDAAEVALDEIDKEIEKLSKSS